MSLFMTYEKAKATLLKLEQAYYDANEKFLDFPKDKNGSTPDKVRFSREYRSAVRDYYNRYDALNAFRDLFNVEFRAEIAEEKKKEAA